MNTGEHKYRMTLSLNVLRHLGFGLYSNIAAVLSEVVANAWDADAENVSISIDAEDGHVTIEDDGHGMTVDDANRKYLTVGYERRNTDGVRPLIKHLTLDISKVAEPGRTSAKRRENVARVGWQMVTRRPKL